MKVFSLSNKNQSEYYELDFRDFRKVSYQNLYYIMGHPILTLFSVLVNGLENTNSLHFFSPSNSLSTLSSHFMETLLATVTINLHIFISTGHFSVLMKNPLATFQFYSDLIHAFYNIDLFLLLENCSLLFCDMTISWFFSQPF